MEMKAYLSGLPLFAAYLGLGVLLWAMAVAVYVRLTPHSEFGLAAGGNVAAAIQLAGSCVGLALPIASLIIHSVSLADMVLWALVALAVQVATWFVLSRTLFRQLHASVEEGRVSVAVVVAAISLCLGILNAASLTY